VGLQGPAGQVGAPGIAGPLGDIGSLGANGNKGAIGSTGLAGMYKCISFLSKGSSWHPSSFLFCHGD